MYKNLNVEHCIHILTSGETHSWTERIDSNIQSSDFQLPHYAILGDVMNGERKESSVALLCTQRGKNNALCTRTVKIDENIDLAFEIGMKILKILGLKKF